MIGRILMLSCAAALLTALPASAQSRDKKFFQELDSDKDGSINREEYTLNKAVILYDLDSNRSLKLEQKETKLSPDNFRQYAGADGVIDGLEMFQMPQLQFDAFDRNRDQKISRDEFAETIADFRSGGQTAQQR